MQIDKFGQAHQTSSELCALLYKNPELDLHQVHIDDPDEFNRSVKELFSKFFIGEIDFEPKSKRKALITNTLWGEEILFDIKTHPRCYFYPQHVAQIKESYENSLSLTNPFRWMHYPTNGEKKLLPYSHETDRVFISTKKHEQNLELKRFEGSKLIKLNQPTAITIDNFCIS